MATFLAGTLALAAHAQPAATRRSTTPLEPGAMFTLLSGLAMLRLLV